LGFADCKISYAQYLWPSKQRDTPDPNHIRTVHIPRIFKNKLPDLHVLDIEHWPKKVSKDGPKNVEETITKLETILDIFRESTPSIPHGLYGLLPTRNYWTPVRGKRAEVEEWQEDNIFLSPLGNHVDVICPSLYTFYDEPENWVTYAKANIDEARRYNKPVVPFIWPQYHVSNKSLKGTLVSRPFWRTQLETMHANADGVVIWGGFREEWDANAPWFEETVSFIKQTGAR